MWPLILCGRRNSFRAPKFIFTCFSTFQQPFQATARNFFTFESHLHVFFYVPTAISSHFKDFLHPRESFSCVFLRCNFLHPRESFSRVFLRSKSHFKQRQGISSPSRVIFTCFSTFQQPFQATARICFALKNHFHVFFYVPTAISSHFKDFLHRRESSLCVFLRPNSHFKQLQGFSSATFNAPYAPNSPLKVPQSPLNAPLSPGFTLKGWVTYWIERQCTICPQVPPKGSPVPPKCPLVPGFTLKGWVTYWEYCGLGANVTPSGLGANVTLF